MKPRVTMRKALADPKLLGNALPGDSWKPWRTILIAANGGKLTDDERELFQKLTGREHEPDRMVEEFIAVVGRRGGKSRAISTIGTYIGGLCKHPALVRGERGLVLIIAPDQKQADICLDYCEANFRASPILRQLIETRTARSLKLTNHIAIEVRASDFRSLRGPTYVAVIADESAFWLSDNSSNPDTEILNSVRPGLATTSGPLIMISSPYARRGELWNAYNKYFGPAGDPRILVAQAPSRVMNPSLPQSVVDRAYERDPASAAAEYGGQFRTDLEAYVSIEVLRACVSQGVYERAPNPDIAYRAFVDPSGGSQDSFTLAIGHAQISSQVIVIDAVRETKPPFSPEAVVHEFSNVLKSYGISTVVGDKYGGEWPREVFEKCGIIYDPAAKPKSDLYQDALALINSRRIELIDNQGLISQLTSLERRTARSGRDSIDHPSGGHDDVANAVAGAASVLLLEASYDIGTAYSLSGPTEEEEAAAAAREYRIGLAQQVFAASRGRCWPL